MIHAQNTKTLLLTPPGAIVDDAAFATTEIDTKGFDYLTVEVLLGATDIALAALKLTESDESGQDHVDIDGADYSADATLPSATDDNKVFAFHVNLLGRKRFIDVVLTGGDGTAGAYGVVVARLSRAQEAPNSATERGYANELFV